MNGNRLLRTASVVTSAALILGALVAAPADAKKKKPKGCPAVVPVEPASDSGQTAEVTEQPVVKVTDAHTAESPLVFEYSHGAAFWTITQTPVQEDTVFFNLQIESKNPAPGLYVFQEWAKHPGSDMDLYLWDATTGEQVESSGSSNVAPEPVPALPVVGDIHGQSTGAWGLESISGFPVSNCAGYVAESRAFTSPGEDMTLTVWLGEQVVEE